MPINLRFTIKRLLKKCREIVPIILDCLNENNLIADFDSLLKWSSEYIKHLIVDVLIDRASALKTVHNQFDTDLAVLYRLAVFLLFEVTKFWFIHLHPLFFIGFNVFYDLVFIVIQEMIIMWIKIPKLSFTISLKCHKDCPMTRNSQHNAKNQWFLFLIVFKYLNFFVELCLSLLREN